MAVAGRKRAAAKPKAAARKKPAAARPAPDRKPAAADQSLRRAGTVTGDPATVFAALRAILAKHAGALVVKHDVPGRYYLDTRMPHPRNKQPMFFGAAVIMKSYVSFHLMPVYAYPELLEQASPELRKRMQGKSCFNFKTTEPALFRELATLAGEGLKRFRATGLA